VYNRVNTVTTQNIAKTQKEKKKRTPFITIEQGIHQGPKEKKKGNEAEVTACTSIHTSTLTSPTIAVAVAVA